MTKQLKLYNFHEVLTLTEGREMLARIQDGYTRSVGIGDGVNVPEVDFVYRPLRGAGIQEHIYELARTTNPMDAAKMQREALAGRIDSWEAGGFDSTTPSAEELADLDGLSFRDAYNVIFSGSPPERVFDRETVKTALAQDEDDAGN